MQASPAWRSLGGNAVKALLYIASFESPRTTPNGSIYMSWRHLGEGIGRDRKTAGAAIEELIAHGFLRETEKGHFDAKSGPASKYRMTWRAWPGRMGPTDDWKDWTPPNSDGTKKRTRTGVETGPASPETETTGPIITPVDEPKPQKPVQGVGPFSTPKTVTTGEPVSDPAEYPETCHEIAAGVFPDCDGKPQSMTSDAWMLAQRRAAKNPPTVDPDIVRDRVREYLGRHGRGAQSTLAKSAGVPGGSLSRFLHQDAGLPDRHCSALIKIIMAAGPRGRVAA